MSLGFKSIQYQVEEVESNCIESSSKNEITLSKMAEDIDRVINEYCNLNYCPLRVGENRDKWLLERVKKIKVRYFDVI